MAYALDRSSSGIGRYSSELIYALRISGVSIHILYAGRTITKDETVCLSGASLLPGLLTIGQPEIAWAARQHKLDLIHDPTGTCPLLLARTGKVITIHDVFPYVSPKTSTTLDWLIYHFWLPLAVRGVDAVITDSTHSKADILRYFHLKSDKVTVIPAAAGDRYQPLEPAQVQSVLRRYQLAQPYILYVGSIEPRKNLLRLLQAYARLRDDLPAWKLVIVGARNAWKSTPISAELRKLNLTSWVQFTGYVPEEDLPALYNGASLFVFPSLYEGFGLPVLEAMACGTPVITSNISSLPEVAGDAALLVDPYNVDEIAAVMRRVLSDPDLCADLRHRGLERAKEFSWERTARQTLEVYRKVLGEA